MVTRDTPAQLAAASPHSLGLWRYRDLLAPELKAVPPITLGEGWTPLIRSRHHPNLFLKQESLNPTGSLEARAISVAVSAAKHAGHQHLALASTGNAASAVAAYCAAAGLTAHLYIPQNCPDTPLADQLQSTLFGADLHHLPLTVPGCVEALRADLISHPDWLNIHESFALAILEGQKTLAYELTEQLAWTYPAAIFYPNPTPHAVPALTAAFDALEALAWIPPNTPRPQLHTIPFASDEAILAATRKFALREGILLSPEAASAFHAYETLLSEGTLTPSQTVVLIEPTAPLKHTPAIARSAGYHDRSLLPKSLPVGGIITPV